MQQTSLAAFLNSYQPRKPERNADTAPKYRLPADIRAHAEETTRLKRREQFWQNLGYVAVAAGIIGGTIFYGYHSRESPKVQCDAEKPTYTLVKKAE